MSQRLNEYLAREAGDYLDQMVELLRGAGPPDLENLLRLARGARGSAQMAGAETIAGVAERLEDAARSVVSGTIHWSDEVRGLVLSTVEDLQVLLRAMNRWGPEEEARVRAALERWDEREEPVVEISTLFYDDEGPHVLDGPGAAASDDGEVVPIETLLLRGDDALREALALRPRLESLLSRSGEAGEARSLVEELFDLVRLGQTESRPTA